ncbi:glycosyltransferase family 4 protein [Pontibacter burrus]|uniref:Glycosyltransferase family 4 protein n=1 Tax=Pontibacter burrus TaxID=2704466 RepID=A0A6B3LSW1_9BACT|nr:glycosyltransferase family 4 protein [Pontibacter burrus]NEM98893.1 glycosyltransferase family 4 protein [Pontibacter burrus]
MKIAVVLPSSEPYSQHHGGALARWVHEVYPLIGSVQVDVFTPSWDTDFYPSLKIRKIGFSTIKYKSRFNIINRVCEFINHYTYPVQIALRIKLNKYDAIHILNRCYYVDILKRINKDAKVILHLQNDNLEQLPIEARYKIISKVDLLLNCSNYLSNKAIMISNLSDRRKIKTIYNGANQNRFALVQNKSFNEQSPKILFVGRLVKEKGVDLLIRAFLGVLNAIPGAELHIVGSLHFGDNRVDEFISHLQELSINQSSIFFHGFVPNDKLHTFYSSASLFVCPSVWEEPFGMVIAEAMLSGVPVIASNRGGIPEVLGDCGVTIDPEDIGCFSKAIVALLTDKGDLERYSKLGRERILRTFTWEVIAENMIKILEESFNGIASK